MASTTLLPIADLDSAWVLQGVEPTVWQALTDGNDSTYIAAPSGNAAQVEELSTPSDGTFSAATAVTVNLRAMTTSSKHTTGILVQIYQSDGVTPLTAQGSTGTITTSWVNYGIVMTLSGSQTLSAWTDAQLWIGGTSENIYGEASEASVTVAYTQSGGGGGGGLPVTAYPAGSAGGSSSVCGSFGRKSNRIEGVRFRYQM